MMMMQTMKQQLDQIRSMLASLPDVTDSTTHTHNHHQLLLQLLPMNNNNNAVVAGRQQQGGISSSSSSSVNVNNVDASLLERYRQARNVYLQRRVLHSLFEQVETFQVDEHTGKPHFVKPSSLSLSPSKEDDDDDEQEEEEDEEEQHRVLSKLQACVQRIQDRQMELQVQLAAFTTKRDELEQMVHEVAASVDDDDGDDDNDTLLLMMNNSNRDDDNDNTMAMDQVAAVQRLMQEQEDKLIALQQRKAAMEAQIRHVDKENLQFQKRIKTIQHDLLMENNNNKYCTASSSDSSSSSSSSSSVMDVTHLQEQNSKMQSDIHQLEEIHAFYQHLTQIVEELGGIRILSIQQQHQQQQSQPQQSQTQAAPENEPPNSRSSSSSSEGDELSLTVLMYGTHKIQLGLKVVVDNNNNIVKRTMFGGCGNNNNHNNNLKVIHATFLTSPMLQSTTHKNNNDNNNNNNKSIPAVQLRIPDLMDLVGLAEQLAPAENLRFVLREAAARIRTLQARVEELVALQTVAAVTKIYPIQNHSNNNTITSFGGDDQEVICSLEKEQMSVLLRMTPDCPLVKGSVYIAQLVGVGGWDNAIVADIEERVNNANNAAAAAHEGYRRPIDVICAIQKEIQRRQEHDGLQLPPTPTLPARRAI